MSKLNDRSKHTRPAHGHLQMPAPPDQRSRLEGLLDRYHTHQPTGGTPEFRERVNEILDGFVKVRCANQRALSNLVNKVIGMVVQLGRQRDPGDQAVRTYTLTFLEEMKEAFSLPSNHQAMPRDYALNSVIQGLIQEGDPVTLTRFLLTELSPSSKTVWNSKNLVSGIYHLSQIDPAWPYKPNGHLLAEAFSRALSNVTARESFSAHSFCNLVSILPTVLRALERAVPSRPIAETSLINSVSRALDSLSEPPSLEYVKGSVLFPLRDVRTCALSPDGRSAVTRLAARVASLLSSIEGFQTIEMVATTFHAMNGIESWCDTAENDGRLRHILGALNRALESTTEPVCSVSVGSILYGLKGVDYSALSEESAEQVSQTLSIISKKMQALPAGQSLNAGCISAVLHSLSGALNVKSDPTAATVRDLLSALAERIPKTVNSLEEMGFVASALIPLSTSRSTYIKVVKPLFECVERSASENLTMSRERSKDLISYQTITQMYALYAIHLPAALATVLEPLTSEVQRAVTTSGSERRIGEWIRSDYKVRFLPISFKDGYNLDLVLAIETSSGSKRLINIEVDGPHHREPVQRVLDAIRDKHLKSVGFEIARIPSEATREKVHLLIGGMMTKPPASWKPSDGGSHLPPPRR